MLRAWRGRMSRTYRGRMSLYTFLRTKTPPPCFLFHRLVATNWLQKRLHRDGLARGAGDGARTRDSLLGRQELYQLSYSRVMRIGRAHV